MRSLQAVVLFCFIKLIAVNGGGKYQNIARTAQIDNPNRIESYVNIGGNVQVFGNSQVKKYANLRNNAKIGPNCEIGMYSTIGADAVISNGSIIGNYCTIDRKVSVSNVRTSNYVTIGERSILHDNCKIQSHATIGYDVELFENVFINSDASIAKMVRVGSGSVFDKYSSALAASRIGSNVCIGNYASVGRKAVIENNAVLHKYASVKDGTTVFKDEIIIQTPTSARLYRDCIPLDRIKQSQVDGFLNGNDEHVNNILLDLMEQQFDQLVSTCPSADFTFLRLIKSLYVLKLHGRDRYKKYYQQSLNSFSGGSVSISGNINVNGNGIFINGQRFRNDESNMDLAREFHFGSNDNKKILNDEAKDQIIRLLAIQHDSQRNVRVNGDTYCKMLEETKNKLRTVKCDM